MITFATLPKPFEGHFGIIQRNAILSWLQMDPRPEVFLFGDEKGTAELAREFGLRHFPEIARNEHGTPLIHHLLDQAQQAARNDLFCYINADILLLPEFTKAAERARAFTTDAFLMIGDTRCLDITTLVDYSDKSWQENIRTLAPTGPWRKIGMDYFVFPRGTFSHMPAFAVRPYFDNWFVWDARERNVPVIDVTAAALAIHQNHPYAPQAGQQPGMHKGSEAQDNLLLLGGKDRAYRLTESSHRMSKSGSVQPFLFGILKIRMGWLWLQRRVRRFVVTILRPFVKLVRG